MNRIKSFVNLYSNTLWCSVILLGIAVFFVGIWRTPVPTVDGAVRAAMARTALGLRQAWPILYEGRVFADHPPLFIWLIAASFKIFGLNDFAFHLVPRAFAFGCVIVTGLIAIEITGSTVLALLSAIILCTTRDFILSSVRGYIEPMLIFFSYLSVLYAFRARNNSRNAIFAGLAVWLAAFSKGPVALWPLVFCFGLLFKLPERKKLMFRFFAPIVFLTSLWAIWVTLGNHWETWKSYLFNQVLGSAIEGRGGAQQLEPLYFLKILAQYYWPWLPLLLWAPLELITTVNRRIGLLLILGWGYVAAFSLMKWKFWYYIAPAYPAFAIATAWVIQSKFRSVLELNSAKIFKSVSILCFVWIVVGSLLPIPLHHDRIPEIAEFKNSILNSNYKGPIYFTHSSRDHNMISTSGNWYFNRTVLKVLPFGELLWEKTLQKGTLIITDAATIDHCKLGWCQNVTILKTSEPSVLVEYNKDFAGLAPPSIMRSIFQTPKNKQ